MKEVEELKEEKRKKEKDPLFLIFINKNEINVVKITEGVKQISKGSFKEMYN